MNEESQSQQDEQDDEAAATEDFTAEDSTADEERIQQLHDKWLRAQAELDNFRKRARKELEDERRYRDLPLLRDLLPVVDNLQRAMEAAEQNAENESLLHGVKIVADQLHGVFKQHDCHPIQALGEPFDPNLHEAIQQQSTDEHPPGTVVYVTQIGYLLHERVVRPSQVIVSTAAKSE
ncbi:MAG: nucleotide exchange factor GrpE [Pirellulales bacterium]